MKASHEVLEELYNKVLLGAILEDDSLHYTCYLSPAVPGQGHSTISCAEWAGAQDGQEEPQLASVCTAPASVAPTCVRSSQQSSSTRELVLLQLTVIQVLLARASSIHTESRVRAKYRDVVSRLVRSTEVDSKLICMFHNSDKLLSHMATKCLGLLLYFQLKEKMPLSDSCIAFCQKSLSDYPKSDKAIYCLCTLTVAIKEIFKDTSSQKAEIVRQLLTPLDAALEVFYDSLFSQHFEHCQAPHELVTNLLSFLELLELLSASRVFLKSHFTCQRILFLKPSCMLDVIMWPVEAFVQRKLFLLIKKCLLGTVGEDLCRAPVPTCVMPGHPADADTSALADAVLQAVALGLLKTLSVHGTPSCFGGDRAQPTVGQCSAPDPVIRRAVSLVLVKSLEIKFQSCTSANEMTVDLQKYMSALLTFVTPPLHSSLQLHGPCEWLSRVFIEQDDDMLEAAKASLGIYSKVTREWEATENLAPEGERWDRHMHENGCNPHCIFLFFLKNVGFDSSVLLDFLISSETCFLEYFVRYLKLLQKEWNIFLTICKSSDGPTSELGIHTCGCVPSLAQGTSSSRTAPCRVTAFPSRGGIRARVPGASHVPGEHLSEAVSSVVTHTMQAHRSSSLQVPSSLVNYDSSDDSEGECTGQSLASSQQPSLQQTAVRATPAPAGSSGGQELIRETSCCAGGEVASKGSACAAGLLHRTVKCFRELQSAISRLQKKNLFPYNPTALLKLLNHTETMYNKTVIPGLA
ncbi:protein Lines homolog 1 [Ochotona curzoniae]|uniref:protein Lines homolog 1 n=1 Tax=Ochotona curzoniae TaxID=130825 RepID=UPI001B34778C|nr:protein Lines homolog 1 [Ochotona curzoniae]